MDHLGFERHRHLFDGRPYQVHYEDGTTSSSSSNTTNGKDNQATASGSSDKPAVLELSSDEDEEEPEAAGPSSPKRKRKRNKPKQHKETPEKPTVMSSGRTNARPTRIVPLDPETKQSAQGITSTSTRPATNNGRAGAAYRGSALKGPYGRVDNNFEGSQPGGSVPAKSRPFEAGFSKAKALPNFSKTQPVTSSTSRAPWSSPHIDMAQGKENRNTTSNFPASRTSGVSSSVTDARGAPVATFPGSRGKELKIVGSAIQDVNNPATLKVKGAALQRQEAEQRATRSTSLQSSTQGIGIDSNLKFMDAGREPAAQPPSSAKNNPSRKGKEKSTVIDIPDSDDSDAIENADSDSDSLKVSTTKAAPIKTSNSRANGTSSIPAGITAKRKEGYEKGAGNTIHAKPPQATGNTSPDSFSLQATSEGKSEKKASRIGMMRSKDSAKPKTTTTSTSFAGEYVLPLSKVLTEHGEYKAKGNRFELFVSIKLDHPFFGISGQYSKPQNGSAPNLEGMVINPSHIAGITLPTDVTSTMTNVFIEIWPDGDMSESTYPKSGFYFFEVNGFKNGWNQSRLAAEVEHVTKFAKRLKSSGRIESLAFAGSNTFETIRKMHTTNSRTLPLRVQAPNRETSASGKRDSRTATSGQRKRVQDELMQPRQPQHNHEISDVEGEDESAIVVQSIKARPRARPSAGANSAQNPTPWDADEPRTKPSTSSATNGSTSVSTSDSETSAAKPSGRAGTGIATSDFFSTTALPVSKNGKTKAKPKASAPDRERGSSSPELLPEAGTRTRIQHARRSKTRADGSISRGVISDSDSETHPDPKLWEGRLMPEEETALVFPREGTGAVTVINSDINRLAPGEFLNDTLIEYGMKRIWQRIRDMDPVLGDQIHMFSSFFYKKLSPDQKKTDAYQTVRKWTNKVNLFDKKYIFVPINEYFHWYLAVIVNPARILKPAPPKRSKPPPAKRATRASQENSAELADSAKVTTSRFFSTATGPTSSQENVQEIAKDKPIGGEKTVIMDSDAAEDLSEPELPASDKSRSNSPFKMDVDEGAVRDKGLAPASTSKQSSKTQSPNADDVTLDPTELPEADKATSTLLHDQVQSLSIATGEQVTSDHTDDERCYIFTLDSLHSKHTSVINTLKKYLISEAKDKGRLPAEAVVPIADSDGVFKGVAASVPLQPNMSDCGLYVLHFTDVFLHNVKELLPLLTSQEKCSGEVTNKRWHYEKAATKRDAFYKELLEESREWKEWRNQQAAAKASEPEEEASTEDDDEGEDLELVQRQQPTPNSKLGKKRSLRRHSDADEISDHGPTVASYRASTPTASGPKQQQEHSTPKEKGREFVGVEIPSPERQRSRANARHSPTKDYTMALDNSPEPEDIHSTSTPKASTNMQAFTADASDSLMPPLEHDLFDAIRFKVQGAESSATPHSAIKGDTPTASEIGYHHVALGDPIEGTSSLMRSGTTEDTSGEEDSSEEVTDDDQAGLQGKTHTPGGRRSSAYGSRDTQDDSFTAQMISPVASSQGPKSTQDPIAPSQDVDIEDDDKPLEADLSLYSLEPARLTPPAAIDLALQNKIKAALAAQPSGRKRPLSSGSQPSSSPTKTEFRPSAKRVRQHSKDSLPPKYGYNARRRISQSPSPAPSERMLPYDHSNPHPHDSVGSKQSSDKASARKSAASPHNPDDTILISDGDDEIDTTSPAARNNASPISRGYEDNDTQPAFPSQPVVSSSSSQNMPVKEKLGRPASRK